MADRAIAVRLRAEVSDFKRAMAEVATSSDKATAAFDKNGQRINTTAGRMVRSAQINREAWTQAGTSLTTFGLAGAAALGLSTRAAVQWESAWTGVLKTVDGTDAQLAALQDGLRGMALEVSASSTEIANVAATAGQLGVAVGDVEAFTRTMIDLGVSTNLTAEEAATSLARMANIFGTTRDGVSRMGATIVDLGNNSATTESEIVALATRLAAAGKIAGLSEADVFAFASTLSSVGVDAEAGGTALSKVFTSISDATRDGGDKLQTFADVAGVSVADFRKSFETDAAGTIASFIDGMGRMSEAGGSTTKVFDTLQLTDQRLMRAILSTSSAQGLLTDQIELANGAWDDNTALVEEANKRYDTTEAKLQIAKNAINDAAIDIGDNLLPVLASLAQGVAKAAEAFGNLPEPVKQAGTGLGVVASGSILTAGAFLMLFPRVMDTVGAFKTLKTDMPGVASGLGKTAKAAGLASAALAVLFASAGIPKWGAESAEGAGVTTKALLDLADGADIADTSLASMVSHGQSFKDSFTGNDIDSVARALQVLADPSLADRVDNVFSSVLTGGQSTATARLQAEEFFGTIDQGLSSLVQSDNSEAAAKSLENLGINFEDAKEFLPLYVDSLAAADNAHRLIADSAADAGDGVIELTQAEKDAAAAAEEAAQAHQAWVDAVVAANAGFINGGTVWDEAIQKNKDLAQATADATESSTDAWNTFYDGKTVSQADYIKGLEDQVAAQQTWEDNILAIQGKVNDALPNYKQNAGNQFIDSLVSQGQAGADQAKLVAGLSDADFQKVVDLWSQAGDDATTAFSDKLDASRPQIQPTLDMSIATQQYNQWIAQAFPGQGMFLPQAPVNDSHGRIPKYARGTIASNATLGVFGEAGAEALVPLNRPLSQVDPSVRALSAFAQGLPHYASGGTFAPSGGGVSVVQVPVTSRIEHHSPVSIGTLVSADVDSFRREAALAGRRRALGGRR